MSEPVDIYLDKLDDDTTGYTDADIVALASTNPRGAWGRRETLNVADLAIRNEYEEHCTREDVVFNLPPFTSDKQASETRLQEAYHGAYCVSLEMEATVREMHEFMRQFSMRYRIADKVMNLINMNLWRGE